MISGGDVTGNGGENDRFKSRSETVGLLQQLGRSNGVFIDAGL